MTQAREIALRAWMPGAASDLEALAAFDADGNGALDAALWATIYVAAVVAMFPFCWMFNTALKPHSEVFLSPPTFMSANWTLSAFVTLLVERPFARHFLNDLVVSTGSTV